MKHQISFDKFVMVVFGCYFALVIFSAFSKLQSDQIGTIFRKVKEKTLQGIIAVTAIFYYSTLPLSPLHITPLSLLPGPSILAPSDHSTPLISSLSSFSRLQFLNSRGRTETLLKLLFLQLVNQVMCDSKVNDSLVSGNYCVCLSSRW